MDINRIDLYQWSGMERPPEAVAGHLTVWAASTAPEISPSRLRPGVLILPGGGYTRTSAREAEPVALRFLARGFVPFVLEYSCAPSTFPTALREAAMAMRYIRESAAQYQVDPAMVAAMGFSAGGHLCGTLGTMYDRPEVADIGAPQVLRPDALGLCYPVAVSWGPTHEGSFQALCGGDGDLRRELSLDRLVRRDMPPVFLWHTRDDGSVPVRNSLVLAQALDQAGVDFALHVYRHGPHGLSTADELVYPAHQVPRTSWDVTQWLEAMVRFWQELGFGIHDR